MHRFHVFSGKWQQVAQMWFIVAQSHVIQAIINTGNFACGSIPVTAQSAFCPLAARQFICPGDGQILFATWQIASCVLSYSK